MDQRPLSYTGKEPFFFVAYSHADDAPVFNEIRWLQAQGHRVYYDEGIRPGSAWSEELARRIQNCDLLIYFVSDNSVHSEHCKREINFAQSEGKPVLAIHLEPVEMPPGLSMTLSDRQAIMKFAVDDVAYRAKLKAALSSSNSRPQSTPLATDNSWIHLAVDVSVSKGFVDEELDLASSVVRYLSWMGGVFRAHVVTDRSNAFTDYTLHIDLRRTDDTTELNWQLSRPRSEEVVRARLIESGRDQPYDREQMAAGIGEETLAAIRKNELDQTADTPAASLTFAQLIIRADQLNYVDADSIRDRFEAIETAKSIHPKSALPMASAANLKSWKVINGLSQDARAEAESALEESRIALKHNGDDPSVLLSVAVTHGRLRQYESSLILAKRSVRMAPTITGKDLQAVCFCFAGYPEKAVELYQEIVGSLPPGFIFPYVRYAVAQTQAGVFDEALATVTQSTVHYPDDYYGWVVKANILAHLDRREEALACLEKALAVEARLNLPGFIRNTENAYGRTEEQRFRLAGGLQSLKLS